MPTLHAICGKCNMPLITEGLRRRSPAAEIARRCKDDTCGPIRWQVTDGARVITQGSFTPPALRQRKRRTV
jgi:hypothetical protein